MNDFSWNYEWLSSGSHPRNCCVHVIVVDSDTLDVCDISFLYFWFVWWIKMIYRCWSELKIPLHLQRLRKSFLDKFSNRLKWKMCQKRAVWWWKHLTSPLTLILISWIYDYEMKKKKFYELFATCLTNLLYLNILFYGSNVDYSSGDIFWSHCG